MSMNQVNDLACRALSGDKLARHRLMILMRKHPQVKKLAEEIEEQTIGEVVCKKSFKKKGISCPSTINGLSGKTSSRPWKKTK